MSDDENETTAISRSDLLLAWEIAIRKEAGPRGTPHASVADAASRWHAASASDREQMDNKACRRMATLGLGKGAQEAALRLADEMGADHSEDTAMVRMAALADWALRHGRRKSGILTRLSSRLRRAN